MMREGPAECRFFYALLRCRRAVAARRAFYRPKTVFMAFMAFIVFIAAAPGLRFVCKKSPSPLAMAVFSWYFFVIKHLP